jgi:hypothetical protein
MSMNKKHHALNAAAYRAYAAAKPANATTSRVIVNSSSTAPYKPSDWVVRAGANDHLAIASKGFV